MDLDSFYASMEQLDFPSLRARPVAVTNGARGTCVITCSYEARQYGVKTGMRMQEAVRLCPALIQRPSRPHRYAEVSAGIMAALDTVSPDIEVFSIDEAFLELTDCQSIHGTPEKMGRLIRETVYETSGLLCSVGVSGTKTTAKYAAKLNKPNGLVIIPPWEERERLECVPVTELCGISTGIGRYLADRGVHVCGDMKHLPISELARRFGNPGRRIWLMAQGRDPDGIHKNVPPPKQVGAGKVTPPAIKKHAELAAYLQHMAELVAIRLRRNSFEAQSYWIGLLTQTGWIERTYRSDKPTNDGKVIFRFCLDLLGTHWDCRIGVYQVQVTARDPKPVDLQQDLFSATPEKNTRLNAVIDQVNKRYGAFTIAPARMLDRSTMPDVISPAWRPSGHRRTI